MKTRRDRIIMIIASVLAIVIVCLTCIYAATPRVPPWEKEKILDEFNDCQYDYYDLFWCEENGYVDEPGAMRYIGTYGDCYAFFIIGSKTNAAMMPYIGPVKIYGLSRPVYYPVNALVALYHTKPTFSWKRVMYIQDLTPEMRRELYISDWQLERLTRDVEKLAEQYS